MAEYRAAGKIRVFGHCLLSPDFITLSKKEAGCENRRPGSSLSLLTLFHTIDYPVYSSFRFVFLEVLACLTQHKG